MKQIIINNEKTYFWIDKQGRCLNKKTGNYLKGTINGGYRIYSLRWKNKKYEFSAHRLVGEYFISNLKNYPIVHHKDNNRLNNNVDNLEWCDYHWNNLQVNKKENNNQFLQSSINKNEMWKNYKGTIYNISNCGRVLNTKTQKIMKGKLNNKGYIEYCITIDKKKKSLLAHRMVYEAFVGKLENNKVINHIDGNKTNNNVNNLEQITYSENNIHSIYKLKHNIPVYQYDKEYNLICKYDSCKQAADKYNITPQSINQAIQKGNMSCGYYWKH